MTLPTAVGFGVFETHPPGRKGPLRPTAAVGICCWPELESPFPAPNAQHASALLGKRDSDLSTYDRCRPPAKALLKRICAAPTIIKMKAAATRIHELTPVNARVGVDSV